jgi:protein SCO1
MSLMPRLLLASVLWFVSHLACLGEESSKGSSSVCEICAKDSIAVSSFTESDWYAPNNRKSLLTSDLSISLQSGTKRKVSEIFNRPTVLTFLYTRCENPRKCPLVASTVAELQKKLIGTDLDGRVNVCVMTYDPEYDTPEVLSKYADAKGIKCDNNTFMLQTSPKDKDSFFDALKISVNYEKGHVNIHGIQLLVLDKQGRVAKTFHTLIWNNDKVISELKKLLAE